MNVLVKGTSSGTVTDYDGNYNMTVPGPEAILVFSYTGYKSQEVTVGDRSTIDIILAGDAQLLDEVVVVGYGTIRKSDLTGSVARDRR